MQGKHRCLPLEIRFYRTTNLDRVLLLLAIYLAVGALAADCTGGAANNCAQGKCETLDTTQICIQCKTDGNVPINGTCTAKATNPNDITAAGCKKNNGNAIDTDKACGQCDGAYFLYKGGCYSKDGAPGNTMCTAASAGVCSAAATGYFVPPGATKTDQSVWACGDTTESARPARSVQRA